MRIRQTVGTLVLAGGLFVAVAAPAMAGAETPGSMAPSAGPPGQTMGKDGPVRGGGVPGGGAPAGQMPMGKDGPVTAGGGPSGPGGMAPSGVMPAPARAGGLDPMTVGAALSGLGMLTLGGRFALRRRFE